MKKCDPHLIPAELLQFLQRPEKRQGRKRGRRSEWSGGGKGREEAVWTDGGMNEEKQKRERSQQQQQQQQQEKRTKVRNSVLVNG